MADTTSEGQLQQLRGLVRDGGHHHPMVAFMRRLALERTEVGTSVTLYTKAATHGTSMH